MFVDFDYMHKYITNARSYISRVWLIRAMYSKSLPALLAMVLALSVLTLVLSTTKAQAAAGACPTPVYGTDTLQITVPTTGVYTVWARMQAPDITNNAFDLQIDGTTDAGGITCFSAGGGTMSTNTWNWVNYHDGVSNSAHLMSVSLTAGTHNLLLLGSMPGVSVDRVELLGAGSTCSPLGLGDLCAPANVAPPVVSFVSPSNNAIVSGALPISVDATSDPTAAPVGIMKVVIKIDGTAIATDTTPDVNGLYPATWDTTLSTNNSTHKIDAIATDSQNNSTTSSITVTVNNSAPACTLAPSPPGTPLSTASTQTSISLSWTASSPAANCSLASYKISQDGSYIHSGSGLSFTVNNLLPGKSYSFTVTAVDNANHQSPPSSAASLSTKPDTTNPTTPTGLTSAVVTSNQVVLNWIPSTDNVGVTGYDVYNGSTKLTPTVTSGTSFTDTGLTPSTTYNYTVVAYDATGNRSSASSPALSVTTLAGPAACTADLNGDHTINIHDAAILFGNWGTNVPCNKGDLNNDGKVDIHDAAILFGKWGQTI
jgi:chitodextrinase